MRLRLRNKNRYIATDAKPTTAEDWKLGSFVKIKVIVQKLSTEFLLNRVRPQKYFADDVAPTKRKYSWILPMCSLSSLQDNKTKKKNSKVITIRKRFKCPLCKKFFLNKEYVQTTHYKRAHTNNRPFKCRYCNKKFAVRIDLTQHSEIHTKKPHSCNICKKCFPNAHNLETHIRTHDLLGETHACHICNTFFGSNEELKAHLKTVHTRKKIKKLQCPVCSKLFLDKGHLENHLRVHTGEKPHKCSFCSKSFSEQNNLRRHVRGHTKEKPHICKICKKEFSEARNLRRHLDSRKETLPCKINTCDYQFCLMGDLVTHIRSTHSDSIEEKCRTSEEKKSLILFRIWKNRKAGCVKFVRKANQ